MQQESVDSLVASFPDAVLSIDRASTILYANDAALKLFGFAREAFIGRTLGETIIPPDLRQQHARGMARFAETGSGPVIGRRIDITACDHAGRRFPIELLVFLDRDRPGERFHAAIRETSDRVARDAVVTAERERLRQILDATADAWWDSIIDGATRYSESATTLLGVAHGEAPTAHPAALGWIHPADRMRVAEAWQAHLAGSVARFECTHRVVRPDGSIRWVRQRGRAVEFASGRPTRIVGSIADVTEQQEAEEHLRDLQKLELLGLLAGGFAHDLNNLLSAIRGHAALASTEPDISPSALESLSAVQLATTRAKLLTSNLLSLGKPSVDSVERFALRPAIEEIVALVRPGLPRSIVPALDLDQVADVQVELEPSAFQQALMNLLVNARDAMPAGGRLRVGASLVESGGVGPMARITVEDTGSGIAPAVLARIFEPFFTTKGPGAGTGLGLSVVQRVVTEAGGQVTVESDSGRGTRFTVLLPATRSAAVATAPQSTPAASRTVLLVESHEVLRPMLAEAMRASGFAVLEAGSARAALEVVRVHGGSAAASVGAIVFEAGFDPSRLGSQLGVFEEMLGSRPAVVLLLGEGAAASHPIDGWRIRTLRKPFEIGELVEALESLL